MYTVQSMCGKNGFVSFDLVWFELKHKEHPKWDPFVPKRKFKSSGASSYVDHNRIQIYVFSKITLNWLFHAKSLIDLNAVYTTYTIEFSIIYNHYSDCNPQGESAKIKTMLFSYK